MGRERGRCSSVLGNCALIDSGSLFTRDRRIEVHQIAAERISTAMATAPNRTGQDPSRVPDRVANAAKAKTSPDTIRHAGR